MMAGAPFGAFALLTSATPRPSLSTGEYVTSYGPTPPGTGVSRPPSLELVETAISGTDQAVPAEERDYVAHVRAAPTAREALTIYAQAIAGIQERLAPVFVALRDAATTDHF